MELFIWQPVQTLDLKYVKNRKHILKKEIGVELKKNGRKCTAKKRVNTSIVGQDYNLCS